MTGIFQPCGRACLLVMTLASLYLLPYNTYADSTPMSTQSLKDVKQIARRFYAVVDAIGARKMPIAAFDEIAADTFQAHLPGGDSVDREGFKGVIQSFAIAFPGATHEIEAVLADRDRAAVRMTWRGKHSGTFQGAAPTGRQIQMSEMGELKIAGGKVVEFWPLFDSMALMTGVGIATTDTAKSER